MNLPPAKDVRRKLKVVMLATYFPRPTNMLCGPGIKGMAEALLDYGIDIEVISFTSWVPRLLGKLPKARAFATCPPETYFGKLHAMYPRWVFYEIGPFARQAFSSPGLQNRMGWLQARGRLASYIARRRPDAVFATGTVPNGYLARQLLKRHGIPYIVGDYDFGEITACQNLPKRHAIFADVMANASAMIAVSRRMVQAMKDVCPQANAVPVYNGAPPLPTELWSVPRPPEILDKVVIFSAGTFYERKGFPVLVRAFGKIAGKYPNAILRIAGDGLQRPQVDQAIAEAGLQSRVQMLGFQPQGRIFQEMVWSDCFALVGWDEPYATVFVEAGAAGKPIIWASDGGINDVLVDGEHGRSVIPRDVDSAAEAMDAVLRDPENRRRMSQNVQSIFQAKLSRRAYARHITQILLEACKISPEQIAMAE